MTLPFVINPHGRLHEWIAEEKGYFADMGLTNYSLKANKLITKDAPKIYHKADQMIDVKAGAYQTYEEGRDASISSACHWTVNMAASAEHGRLWGECYSVSPCAIVVPADSPVTKPEDLANIDVHVGYQSGSHYATIQALEPFMDSSQIQLTFSGSPADRLDQLLDNVAPAATVFGSQLYIAEQLGFRKIVDCTFMMAAMIPEGIDLGDVSKYYDALRLAQTDIDRLHQSFVHYYLNELPERHAKLIDVRRFGPGERLVFEPYTEAMYNSTQEWVLERGIFDGDTSTQSTYENAVVRL